MAKKTTTEIREAFKNIKPILKWEDVKVGETYHLPPLLLLPRRDIEVLLKTDKEIEVKQLTSTTASKLTKIDRTSVYARILVKKRTW